MKISFLFICISIFVLSNSCKVTGQSNDSENLYVDYNEYVTVLEKFIKSDAKESWSKAMTEIQESTVSLSEETHPIQNIRTVNGTSGILSDEEVYSKRKNSVFLIGKLRSGENKAEILFDLLGTAFAIAEDGTCVTNYHVLQNIILSNQSGSDLVYFIIAANKKVYILNKILAYSKNNDLSVFKIDPQGDKFDPIPLGKPAHVGATVYCISNPAAQMFFFSKGVVARNIVTDSASISSVYSRSGRPPLRMEITAEYGAGSSGGPVLDKSGNVIGIIASTNTIFLHQLERDGKLTMHPQMVLRSTVPVKALTDVIKTD